MIKVAQCSDMHLEFGGYDFQATCADVLVLGGDICVASNFNDNYDKFFKDASDRFKDVIYIMGNHEHYNGDFAKSESILRKRLKQYSNIHFLERQSIKIGDVTFIGGTMWTDMNKRDDLTLMHIANRMNDFVCVDNSNTMVTQRVPVYEKDEKGDYVRDDNGHLIQSGIKMKQKPSHFTPNDAADEFDKFLGYINNVVEGKHDEKFFVCTHHSPSRLSTKPQYQHDYIMNGGFSSHLGEWILDHPQIKVWTHGHTHDNFDYMIGSTRIVCNPRGYIGYERSAGQFELKVIEV